MVSITNDIAGDLSLSEFLVMLQDTGGTLGEYTAIGPGGGNPEVTINFTDQTGADRYAAWYRGDRGVFDVA